RRPRDDRRDQLSGLALEASKEKVPVARRERSRKRSERDTHSVAQDAWAAPRGWRPETWTEGILESISDALIRDVEDVCVRAETSAQPADGERLFDSQVQLIWRRRLLGPPRLDGNRIELGRAGKRDSARPRHPGLISIDRADADALDPRHRDSAD